ncbi:hypothetical protein KHP62_20545 [Rhodobacteraceae bacterium NNCM2]|nr:hypothetical protein [Coraliihabitans acroporae]
MSYPLLALLVGVLLVVAGAIWLRRQRDRFIAELKAQRHPMADAPMDKEFRKQFQTWLLRQGFATPEGQNRMGNVFVALCVAVLIALGVYSFIGGTT